MKEKRKHQRYYATLVLVSLRKTVLRFTRLYGDRSFDLIGKASCFSDLGKLFGADLTLREVTFLCDIEWVISADDLAEHLQTTTRKKEYDYACA